MKAKIKKKWLKALRSEEYNQTKGTLKDEKGYCCLGVLCDLHSSETEIQWKQESDGFKFRYNNYTGVLPSIVLDWSGLDSDNPRIKHGQSGIDSLAELNDNGGDFNEIADVIEKQL